MPTPPHDKAKQGSPIVSTAPVLMLGQINVVDLADLKYLSSRGDIDATWRVARYYCEHDSPLREWWWKRKAMRMR